LRTETGEDGFRPFRHLPCNLDDALAERDPAPLGELLFGLVVARHVLAALAAERADEFRLIGEVVAAIMQGHAVAVARQAT
jgi:hypothetical protein